jgi:hypothetical protein
MGDDDLLSREAERCRGVVGGERGVREDHPAGGGGVRVLAGVHRARPAGHPVREVERDEVVDRRRAEAGTLGRIHPIGEVEHVDRADEALDRRSAEA